MTKSTTVVFILGFAILFKLEKKVCVLIFVNTFKKTRFILVMEPLHNSNNDLFGFNTFHVQSN